METAEHILAAHTPKGVEIADLEPAPYKPGELAGAAVCLLDQRKSSYITWQTICVEGGFTAVGLIATNG